MHVMPYLLSTSPLTFVTVFGIVEHYGSRSQISFSFSLIQVTSTVVGDFGADDHNTIDQKG